MGLSELLSAALVAFTIEFDNAFEQRMPHRTTRTAREREPGHGRDTRPWLVSLAMWENCMRWLPEEGLTVAELEGLARTRTNLDGMRRWGYVGVEGARADGKPGPRSRLVPTARGRQAQELWAPLPEEIEGRWRERLGTAAVARLRSALTAAVAAVEARAAEDAPRLPDTMPIVGFGLATRERRPIAAGPDERSASTEVGETRGDHQRDESQEPGLHALMARLLTAFALAYEAESKLSIALAANVVATLGSEPMPTGEVPTAAGVAKEPVAAAMKFLVGRGLADIVPDPGSKRGRVARLTARGLTAQEAGAELRARLEADWSRELGDGLVDELSAALAPLVGDGGASSPLLAAIEPPEFGWRARRWPPRRLPRFPLVTHRGGFPDGS